MGTVHVVPVFGEKLILGKYPVPPKFWVYKFDKNGQFTSAFCCLSKTDAQKHAKNIRRREKKNEAHRCFSLP